MPCNFQREAIAKFLIPDHPQEDNYPDPDEFEEKEKEWMEQRDRVLAHRAVWVEREQLAENRRVQEATCAAVERMRLRHEVAKRKLKAAAQKKVGAVVEVISCGKLVCARCSMKGLSICNLSVSWLMEVPPGIPCIKRGGVTTGSPGDGKALRGQQTWAQPLGWPLSHRVCWVVSELVRGYHS